MRRFSLIGTKIFMGLFLGLIFFATSFAGENKEALDDASGCTMILLKNQEYFPVLIKAIDEAKSEIFFSFFLFKAGIHKSSYPDRILQHLGKAVQRGVKVIVILENSGGHDRNLDNENIRTKQLLADKGVKIYFDSPLKTTHTKLIVIDERFILLGSHNLTQAALKYNNEVSLLIDKPELAKEVRKYVMAIVRDAI